MCLNVSKTHHPRGEPLVAEKDIIVFKWLLSMNRARHGVAYISPYMEKRYEFATRYEEEMKSAPFGWATTDNDTTGGFVVGAGLHAFYLKKKRNSIRATAEKHRQFGFNSQYDVCTESIIPKGAKYFIGHMGEVVSDALIVYRDEEEMRKLHPDADHLPQEYALYIPPDAE